MILFIIGFIVFVFGIFLKRKIDLITERTITGGKDVIGKNL